MNENMENRCDLLVKWLRVLMYIAIVSLINSLLNFLPIIPASVTTWISRGIMVAMVICMFQLAPANERYKKAGIMRTVMLSCILITTFLYASPVLTLAASILSIIAVYQEYNAHSELVADQDAKLSRKWHSLFNWSIGSAVLVGFGSVAATLIVSMTEMETVRIVIIINYILSVPQLVIEVVYLLYLKKMIAIFSESEAG